MVVALKMVVPDQVVVILPQQVDQEFNLLNLETLALMDLVIQVVLLVVLLVEVVEEQGLLVIMDTLRITVLEEVTEKLIQLQTEQLQ